MKFVKTSMVLSLLLLVCLPYSAYNQSERPSDVRAYCRSAITNQRSISDRRTSLTTTTATVTITNTSSRTIYAPFHAVIEIVNNSGPVTMPDASGGPGTQPYNKYYYNLTGGNLADGQLGPGEAVSFSVKFVRKSAVAFRWDVHPYGVLKANQLPVANAGPDRTVQLGATVVLDGSKSSDADGNYLTFQWSLISVPVGRPVPLSNPNTVTPSFVASQPGTYVLQLIVNDGIANSAPDTVTITTENSKPVANAGPDQTVFVAQAVTLDSSKSSDVDGDLLTYMWSIISLPPESAATLSDPNAVKPTFFVDKPGTYVAQLIVNDGKVDSAADTVSITTENSKPVANAGPDQTSNVGAVVVLDGGMSTDVDGDLLTYRWSFGLKPAGSSAILSDAAAVRPSFTADRAGSYVLQLIVNDGTSDSNPSSVTITTRNSAPVANAGADQSVYVAQVVTLDGSMSTDADGDPLLFWWSLIAKPAASAAALSDPALIDPTFIVDRPGSYVVQLIVNDGNVASAPDTVSITTLNSKPVANAGPDRSASLGTTVSLDGSGSTDADFDALAYRWSFSSKPAGSSAELAGENTVGPSYTPDLLGTYVVQLIVNDSTMDSDPDTVVTEVVPPPNRAPVALDDGYTTAENTLLTVAPGVLANDSDPDGNVLTAILAGDVKHGALSLNADGSFTYQPNPGFHGVDSFTYKAYDGALYSTAATVTINVIQIILPPLVTLEAVADQTIPTNITLSLHLLGHSTDPLAALTYSLVSGPAGAAVLSSGVFSFTPTMDQFGVSHAFTVQVQDGGGRNAQRTFHVTVVDQNHPPVLGALTDDVTAVGASYAKTLAATDPDQGDTLSFTLLSGPAGMTLTGNRLAWTPVSEQLGNWPVQVQVTDQAGASDSGQFHVGLPLVKANDDNYQVTLGQVLTVAAPGVLANDFSPAGGGPLTAHQLTTPDKGTLNAFGADGSFGYTAPPSAPAPPVLDAKVKWNAGPSSYSSQGLHSLLVGNIDGEGKPDVFLAGGSNGLMAMNGDGTSLFEFTGLLPAAGLHCYADIFLGEAALGDLDGDGKAEMIVPVHCMEDDYGLPNPYSLGANNRVAALSYDPTAPAPGHLKVKWVSPTTSIQKARPDGSLYSPVNRLTNYVHFTVARLSPGEPPSVLWGRDFPSTGGTCADVIPGKTDAFCRVVTVHSGIDGSISQRFYYAPPNQTSPGSWGLSEQQSLGGFGAPIVADLMGTGQASILFNGTVWDRAGNVQLELDGTGSPSTANDSVVVDLDGDGKPDILTLNNIRNFYVTDSALRAFRMDGTLLWHLPVAQASRPGRMSVADVDRDGTPEILFQSDNQLWCVDHAGHIKWVHVFDSGVYGGWYTNPGQITRTPVYDLNGDGLLEVVVQYGNNDLIFLRGDDGQTELSWRIPGDVFAIPYSGDYEPVVVDLDGDGHAEIVFLHAASAHAPNGVVVIQGDTVPWRAAPKAFNQRAFNGVNINADSSIPLQPITYWTNAATNVFEQPPPEPYVVDPRLTTQTSFTYAAGLAGRASSDPATVSIDLIPGNRPPVVTSTPPASVNTVGMSYTNPFTYQITAYDPDPGDTLSYAVSFISYGSPTIVTVSPTGLFSYKDYWQPTGLCTYIVDVKDNHGAVTQHTFMIFFTSPSENKTVPNLVGQTATAAAGLLAAVDLQVGVVTHVDNSAPAGQVLSQNPASGTSVLKRSTVDFMVSNGPAVVLPPGPPPQLGNLAKIVVTPSMASRVTGETASFKAIGTNADGTGADITAFVTWSSSEASVAAVDAAGTAHASGAGTTTVTATANGLTGSATLTVVTRVPGDVIPPTAIITSPADGGTVTALAQIIGTASDANFLRYQLAVAPAGDTTWTVIGEGINAVTDGTLGTFDPTILLNDLFTLRLSVFDRNGNETIATSTVQVSGALKVGLFSLTFTDLNIPMAGIPITVTRTYDSRDKAKGDFGIGWRLGVQTLRIRTNRVPGTGWVRNQSGSIIGLVPTSEHKVSVTLPDGKVEEFDLVLSPTSGFGGLDATTVTGYAPRPGTLGKLEMLDNPYLFILNGATEDELVDDTTLKTFEPLHYRYTTLDGTQIEIDRKEGVKKVTDINGNSMTFGPAGIIHSSGKSVTFARDAQNRITKITDSDGNSRTYAYNASGDLVTATDFVDNATGFTYNGAHGLVDINDPAGKRVSRNEYDDAGRVIATTDAQGNRIELMHNLNTQQEIVRDRLGNITVFEYDAAGNIVAKTDALGGRTTYSYDSRGNQLTQTDPLGRISTKTYDAANHVLSSTDFDGNTTTSTYNAFGQSLTRTTPEGHTTTHAYDAKGNLTQVTDPEGGVTRHTYNSTGGRLSTTDPFGNVTEFVLDASGNTITEIDTLGNVTSYTYNANGLRLTQTKPGGRVTQYAYDAMGRMIRTTDALGQQSSVTYSAIGDGKKPATGTNEMGQITVFDYDALGNLLQTMSPDGSSSTATYDAEGRTTSKTNRDGHTTTFQYDALGRQTRTIHPDGTSMMKTYDAVGRILAETDERGHSSTYSYAPNQQNVTDALGNVTVHRFDSQGRRLRMTDALGRVTTFAYNSKGNVLLTTLPDGSTTMTAYDAVGRKIADTDQAGQTTQFDYDAAGRLIRVTDATGSVTIYTYDPVGNRLSQTDANGHTTRMTYDVLNRMTSRIRPLGQQETFGYDAVGNQTTHTDFNGQITTFVFNSNNQLIRKNFSDGNAVNYAYTSEGLRLQAGGDTYTYDRRSRMLEEQKTSGAVIAYTYDATGNRTSVTSSQGTITYTYDVLNRLNSVVDVTGTTTYAYEAAGNLASMVYPNGVTTTYTYDTLNRLIQMSSRGPAGLIASYSYTLAPTGNRVRVIEAGPATTGRIVSYAYDNVYRLTQEKIDEPGTTSDQTITYNYDTIGNRTQMNRNGVLTTYAYDANDRLLTETSGALTLASTYDNNGNLKTRGDSTVTDSYAYNAENRLVSAQVQSGAKPGPVAYTYDADGIRTGIKAGGVTTTFLVDKNTDYAQAISETVGATTATYTYGNSQIISQTRLGEGTHFYLADGHQSTRQLTDSLGAVSASYTYDAFGVQLQASGTTSNDFLYTGEQFDPNIGFYYLRARYYSQKTGRFVSTDAYEGNIFDPISLHRYLYAHGNPVDMRDPSGNATLSEIGAASFISGSIGATASLAALGVKAWTGQPVTWADAGRAIATGFAIGAIGGAIAESAYAIGAAGQVINTGRILFSAFTVAALNTANQVFFIHKRQDVTYSDVSTQAIMNGVIQGLGFGAGEAFQMVGKTIHGIASTGAVNVAIGGFVKSGPKDSLIVWRKQDRCPTNIWYDKSSDGSYKVNRSDVPVAGCNVIDLVVKFYALEF